MRALMESEYARVRRNGGRFAVILTDIDYFKRVNDSFGHDCGDFVLREVAARLSASLREQDAASRWGGEEFLVLLPETSMIGAIDAAERMRRMIELGSICYCGNDLAITMTFGVTVCSGADSIDQCINRADLALYDGKREGRNRVSSLEEAPAIAAV
jgi:diguanylate cyclase (GGDEF)-like protein